MNSNEIPLNYFYREYSQNYRKIVLERQVQLLKDGIKSYHVYLIGKKENDGKSDHGSMFWLYKNMRFRNRVTSK